MKELILYMPNQLPLSLRYVAPDGSIGSLAEIAAREVHRRIFVNMPRLFSRSFFVKLYDDRVGELMLDLTGNLDAPL